MKFKLIIDEKIELDRTKIQEKVEQMATNKNNAPLFNFGDLKRSEEDIKIIEHKIMKLDNENYQDK